MDISSLMSSFGTYTPPTTNNTEEQKMNNEQKLASIEMQKMASSMSLLGGTSSIDPQTLNQSIGEETDNYMLSEEAQEEMINISGTKGNDNIKASINEETGNIIFNINGKEQEYTPEEAANGFKIDTGKGNDNIDLSAIMGNFVIDAGDGNNNLQLAQGRNVVNVGNGNNNITAENAHRNSITTGNGNNNIDVTGDINTINTGRGRDTISVSGNSSKVNSGAGNDTIIANDGTSTIDGGKGNDTILAGKGNHTIDGGKGNDTIIAGDGNNTINGGNGKDTIVTGNGNNTIDGGKGNDTIVAGNGNNNIYGRDGNDIIVAGNGKNYIEGGKGNDNIVAGNGNNIIYGLDGRDNINVGSGDNYIDGGKGNDRINAGDGKNIIFGGKGRDYINTSSQTSNIWDDNRGFVNAGAGSQVNRYAYNENSNLGSSISVNGDDDFKMRVESDLESYRHLQTGQKMLSELDNSGYKVDIQATTDQNGYATAHDNSRAYVNSDGTRGAGTDTTISYNPSFNTERLGKPLSILFHEMAHAYDNATGTKQPGEMRREDGSMVNRRENQAVGLSTEGGIEVEHPDGTVTTGNPEGLTENAIRTELGLDERTRY